MTTTPSATGTVLTEPTVPTSMDLLRLAAVGSVDDGKSTLIGRLLHDTKQLFDDQLAAVEEASARRGSHAVDLSFVTDGLRAEREQGITIDVAYRYAATPTRKLVIADCPGHVQYTRNMATGASNADVALVVVDALRGSATRPAATPASPPSSVCGTWSWRPTRWTWWGGTPKPTAGSSRT